MVKEVTKQDVLIYERIVMFSFGKKICLRRGNRRYVKIKGS